MGFVSVRTGVLNWYANTPVHTSKRYQQCFGFFSLPHTKKLKKSATEKQSLRLIHHSDTLTRSTAGRPWLQTDRAFICRGLHCMYIQEAGLCICVAAADWTGTFPMMGSLNFSPLRNSLYFRPRKQLVLKTVRRETAEQCNNDIVEASSNNRTFNHACRGITQTGGCTFIPLKVFKKVLQHILTREPQNMCYTPPIIQF